MTELIKSTLLDDKKAFAVALGSTQEVANKYLLGVYNTIILNDELMKCTAESIRDAAITSAVLGIAIDARQYAYLVPYGKKAQFQLSYKGYVSVAKRDADVDNIQSNIVYQDDIFSIDVGANTLSHIPNLDSPIYGQELAIKYVYAVVRFRSNTGRAQMFEVMTKAQVDTIKGSAKQSFIWNKHYGEMARKTVIKRLCKHAQLGDVARFDEIDNSIEQGKIINVTPQGELLVNDSIREDKEKMIELIKACVNQQQLDKIFLENCEKMEELISAGVSTEINKLAKAKKDEFDANKIMGLLSECEDLNGLEKVYNNWERSLKGLTAASRNDVVNHYCGLKQTFSDMAA